MLSLIDVEGVPVCNASTTYVCLSVGVSKLQVAILARSSREMSRSVRID